MKKKVVVFVLVSLVFSKLFAETITFSYPYIKLNCYSTIYVTGTCTINYDGKIFKKSTKELSTKSKNDVVYKQYVYYINDYVNKCKNLPNKTLENNYWQDSSQYGWGGEDVLSQITYENTNNTQLIIKVSCNVKDRRNSNINDSFMIDLVFIYSDLNAPTITANSWYKDNTWTTEDVTVKATDSGSGFKYFKVNGKINYSSNITFSESGIYEIEAFDNVENKSTMTVKIDKEKPTLSVKAEAVLSE